VDTNAQIVAAIVVVGILVVARLFLGGGRPKERSFRCARCSASAMHTARTIEAWRRGKTRFFCDSCHGEWLRSQPKGVQAPHGGRSGCLGSLIVLVAIPAAVVVAYLSR
jgi:hypothetical protein